ncbi:MAG: carbohydrate ABC transporter permease [bacterium]
MHFLNRLKPEQFSLKTKKSIIGFLFTLPFIIGFILFFLVPFVQSFIFSLNELILTSNGYKLNFVEIENYSFVLFEHPEFVRVFVETLKDIIIELPLIIFFSLFISLMLNQKFKGRIIMRTIFFIPIILSAGVITSLETSDFITESLMTIGFESGGAYGEAEEVVQIGPLVSGFINQLQIPHQIISFVEGAVSNIQEIVRSSAIQILIFLSGLQSISSSLYECAKVEGASKWESFWLITFPLLTPIIIINVVYTIIDSFLDTSNELVIMIQETAFGGAGYGESTAMGILYFLAITLILVVIIGVLSRWVVYHEN